MEIKLIEREQIIVGGISVETNLADSERDVETLYNDFYGKVELLNRLSQNENEYYGVIWYTRLHESYKYLIGQKLKNQTEDFEIKPIPKGLYACAKFPKDFDGIKAWTDFYNEIPKTGYKPKEKGDLAFEFYPNGLEGGYELWSLVEKIEQ